jgi:hypothetical protein
MPTVRPAMPADAAAVVNRPLTTSFACVTTLA